MRSHPNHLGLEILVTVQAHTSGSNLFGDITNPMLVLSYNVEVAWIFHQQLRHTVFQVLQLSIRLYLMYIQFECLVR